MKRIYILVLVLLAYNLYAQDSAKTWDFDRDKTGQPPSGFTAASGDWKIAGELSAPSKPNALFQSARSSSGTFNLALANETLFKDVDISVRMKAAAGKTDQGGGLVWRAKDAGNYYVARYNPLEDNYRVYKVVNGKRSGEMQSAAIKHSEGWHILRVIMAGDHIECFYDGKKYLDVKDGTLKDAGRIGLWTKADAQTYFDDLTVTRK